MCSIDGCSKKTVARNYCKMHYLKWYRYGDPLIKKYGNVTECKVKGCERGHVAKGYCDSHYANYYFENHVQKKKCAKCDKPLKAKGLCKKHYMQMYRKQGDDVEV